MSVVLFVLGDPNGDGPHTLHAGRDNGSPDDVPAVLREIRVRHGVNEDYLLGWSREGKSYGIPPDGDIVCVDCLLRVLE